MVPLSFSPRGFLRHPRLLLVVVDSAAIVLAILIANTLRFDEPFPTADNQFPAFHRWLQFDLLLTPIIFYFFGLYQSAWRYASIRDMLRIAQAVLLRTAAVILAFVVFGHSGLPRSVVVIDTLVLLLAIGGFRLLTRVHGELRLRPTGGRAVLIVGAGQSGEMIVREMLRRRDLDYSPVGFVDDDPDKHGVLIHGLPVFGGRDEISEIVRTRGVKEVIVAVPSASAADLRDIRARCGDPKVRLKAVPAVNEMLGGPAGLRQVREVAVEDLLGREPVVLDGEAIRRDIEGHPVLVTGGGGSIGRELARQLAALKPSRLILIDRSENNLFAIGLELQACAPEQAVSYCIADIQDERRMREIYALFRPRVVYHAAAYKHVPMMEFNPLEAVGNNILGTRLVARLAAEFEVGRFVLISTDKAVNPVNVMGKTKRVAELIVQSLNGGGTRFIAVRFGNVLGSDGSVVPIFRQQIAAGGPVTVTHPEISRYFMTIPEAVQLVMQAGTMGTGGEIFMLDMGQPVKIVDLAQNIIELSGFRPNVDIDIVFTGLRPGERLHEQLYMDGEETQPTAHGKIVMLSHPPLDPHTLALSVADLESALATREPDATLARLTELVDAFAPNRRVPSDHVGDAREARLREAYT